MRLHLVALPHTQTTKDYLSCAYTQKVVKFCRMMRDHTDHEVYLYSGEQNEAPAHKHIQVLTEAERAAWFGDGFNTVETPLVWDARQPYFATMNERVIAALGWGNYERDLLLLTTGWPQQPIADAHPAITACEFGVGYEGISTKFAAFESYAWMHHVYGLRERRHGSYYDRVIPNYFDLDDFPAPTRRRKPGDYLLFVGRVIQLKGVYEASLIAERVGMPLIVAGPGVSDHSPGEFIQGDGVRIEGDVYYAGEVGVEERATLMEGADALLAPTIYVEPFGGVAVEAMLSGTPVVAPDYGAFTETVVPGASGSRFATLQEGADAVVACRSLRPTRVRTWAAARYSLEAIAPLYDRWFRHLDGLWGVGWPA